MSVQRSKAASKHGTVDIHTLVRDWYADVAVPYVAHAFLNDGTIVRCGPVVSAAASNQVSAHPDQKYWRTIVTNQGQMANAAVTAALQGVTIANITRIDIDCKLMPCNNGNNSCLFQVSAAMRGLHGLANIPLRIFSHADENMAGAGSGDTSTKRVIICNTNSTNLQLTAAYNAHDGWGWVA